MKVYGPCVDNKIIQGYPERMRLQRRLYGIYSVCFLTLPVFCNCNLIFFFAKSFNNAFNDHIQGRRLIFVQFYEFHVVFTVSSFVGNPVGRISYKLDISERHFIDKECQLKMTFV